MITSSGTLLAQATLDRSRNYVATAGVTALAPLNDALQCRMFNSMDSSWDDLGETDVSQRVTVPLEHEHAYPTRSPGFGTYTVSVACISKSLDYVVDTGHLYIWQVGSINSTGGPVIGQPAPKSFTWR